MVLFRCTKKLLDHLGVKALADDQLDPTPTILGSWYAKWMVVERRNVVLWTNESTLYSFAALNVRKNQPEQFHFQFMLGLEGALMVAGIPPACIARISQEYRRGLQFATTNNRSVVAGMNQIGRDFETLIWYNRGFSNVDLAEMALSLNTTPRAGISEYSVDLVRERCAALPT